MLEILKYCENIPGNASELYVVINIVFLKHPPPANSFLIFYLCQNPQLLSNCERLKTNHHFSSHLSQLHRWTNFGFRLCRVGHPPCSEFLCDPILAGEDLFFRIRQIDYFFLPFVWHGQEVRPVAFPNPIIDCFAESFTGLHLCHPLTLEGLTTSSHLIIRKVLLCWVTKWRVPWTNTDFHFLWSLSSNYSNMSLSK